MSKNRIVFLIGLLLLLIPFTGFPSVWKSFFHIIFGLVLVGLSFSASLKRRGRLGGQKSRVRQARQYNTTVSEKAEVDKMTTPILAVEPAVEEIAEIKQEKSQSDVSVEVAKKEVSEI